MKRSNFLAAASSASAVAWSAASAPSNAATTSIPITGPSVRDLAAFDRVMVALLERWDVPGGQCAVAKDGRLVYAHGFGYVGVVPPAGEKPREVSPTARFRIASSTKPFTAVAILRLVEKGRLDLEERAFDILRGFAPPPGASVDPRLKLITVRHLLEHSGGFIYPNAAGIDPQFDGLRFAADSLGRPYPSTAVDIIRWVMGQPLAFTPGTQYAYSNVGYNILGRIIEHRTQLSYGRALKKLVLEPAGIRRFELMTRTSPQWRLPDEVFYFDGATQLEGYSIYDDDPIPRKYSYGGFDGHAIDAHGGGIANAPDLTRFLDAVDGTANPQLLSASTIKTMLTRPNIPHWAGNGPYYALGWNVDAKKRVTMAHNGAITFGTCSSIIRLEGGITLAAVFNHLDPNVGGMVVDVQDSLIAAAFSVKHWPAANMYQAAD